MFSFLFPKQMLRDRWVAALFLAALVVNMASWILVLARTWGLRGDVSQFALHYTIYFGVDRLGPWWQIFRGPFAGLIFWMVHMVAGAFMFTRERAWTIIIGIATVLLEVLILLGSMLVVLLNV